MSPYRTPYNPPTVPKPPESTQKQILDRALKAIDHFNNSCSSGYSIVAYQYAGDDTKNALLWGSPHSIKYIIGGNDIEKLPCCLSYRQDLMNLQKLSWWWRIKAKWAIGKKSIYINLVEGDRQLTTLLGLKNHFYKSYTHSFPKKFKLNFKGFEFRPYECDYEPE